MLRKDAGLSRMLFMALVLILVVSDSISSARAQGKSSDLQCFAFLLNGDVWVNCDGEKHQITRYDDVEDFAVAPRGGVLALVRHRAKAQGKAPLFVNGKGKVHYLISHAALQLVHLTGNDSGTLLPLAAPTQLQASCGTILSITWDPAISTGNPFGLARDVVSGEIVAFAPYKNFRCNSDRRVVAGWFDPQHVVLWSGIPPQRELIDAGAQPLLYDVSPNGRHVAYSGNGKLCVAEEGAAPVCISLQPNTDRLSVSDLGEVLFVTTTEQGCYYRDQWHISATPRPGYNGGDVCVGVAYWRPGDKSDALLEFLSRNPQWITREAASALLALRSRGSRSQKNHP